MYLGDCNSEFLVRFFRDTVESKRREKVQKMTKRKKKESGAAHSPQVCSTRSLHSVPRHAAGARARRGAATSNWTAVLCTRPPCPISGQVRGGQIGTRIDAVDLPAALQVRHPRVSVYIYIYLQRCEGPTRVLWRPPPTPMHHFRRGRLHAPPPGALNFLHREITDVNLFHVIKF